MPVQDGIAERIAELKARRHAVILAHNYQRREVQEIADFTGDSLELSRRATEIEAEVVVFCGVHFMAETAAILNPGRTVLIPDPEAGCPMADMITGEQLRDLKARHPGARTICYVNSTAEVKAESDCCCTSANAARVVQAYADAPEILFVPDKYLGQFAAEQTGIPLVLWDGFCPTHARLLESDITAAREAHPGAVVMCHPECTKPVRDASDAVLSTGQMCRFVREDPAREFIVGTELDMVHRLRLEAPGKVFHPISSRCICPNMKKITLAKVFLALERLQYRVTVPEAIRGRAEAAIRAMLEVAA
ncbi:MAG: quinolinate synthase NadA [Lentisphaeria bacterium]|nr:quinolinate synthase NadA [Lentisphaeria bacterium]